MPLFDSFLIIVGIAMLFYGADWLVEAAAKIATSFGIPALIVGLTLVAFGTSVPELLVSVIAASQGSSDIALGNVVGSNVANIGLVLGSTVLLFPIAVNKQVVRKEMPIMLGFSLLTFLLAWNGVLGRVDGLILFLGLVVFNVISVRGALKGEVDESEFDDLVDEEEVNLLLEVGRVVVGILVLVIGAQCLVTGATSLARAAGVSELVIALTLVAFGTSLPELATSMVSAFRGQMDISVGNIVGSNIYNLLAVLGLTSLVKPIAVAPEVLAFELPVMLVFSFVLWPLLLSDVLGRWQGAILFGGYLLFMTTLFI